MRLHINQPPSPGAILPKGRWKKFSCVCNGCSQEKDPQLTETMMSLNSNVYSLLEKQLAADSSSVSNDTLNQSLRLLSKWRSVLIQNTLLSQEGTLVNQGPLKGLNFISTSAEGCHVAKLLGTYEQPLQPFIESAIHTGYQTILNIGCAEGYYAVGMSLRMPNTQVLAFDIDARARESCLALGHKNGVDHRLIVGNRFNPEDFSAYAEKHVLVMCDIEGAERELLDPAKSPSLRKMDIIVESHECLVSGITQLLIERFKHTHQITIVKDNGQRILESPPQWFYDLAHLDQLLATWEWRSGPTPWLVMKPGSTAIS